MWLQNIQKVFEIFIFGSSTVSCVFKVLYLLHLLPYLFYEYYHGTEKSVLLDLSDENRMNNLNAYADLCTLEYLFFILLNR